MFNNNQDIHKVALYTRVSTIEQSKEGFSLENQIEKLRSYCIAKDWTIVKEYQDGGYSGRNTKRPNYNQMLQDLSKFDAIVVYKMDRIHRNQKNFIAMMGELRKHNKEFISMQESFDTSTAMGRFVMNILQLIAQLESEQIGERVAVAMETKAKDLTAGFIGHRTAYGYTWDNKKEIFKEDPEKLEIVKKAFDLYINGKSFREISKILNKADTTIRYYLNNIFYAGYERYCHYFKKINNGFKPIISPETWNTTQIEMRSRARSHNYDPLLIPEDQPEIFILNNKEVNLIPTINRAKHNYNF